jgi:hypothetical protein
MNACMNSCTKRDLEVRSRMLFARTGIRYLFITQDLDYFLPQDSLQLFLNEATRTFSTNTTDDVIIALYVKMYDASLTTALGQLLVKQINGSWLTAADIDYAQYNSGGSYKNGAYYKYKSLFKNIPKPLILCYQVAKINGLLTTAYFNKSQSAKGSEQIYYHVFKMDKAFRQLKEAYSRLDGLLALNNNSANGYMEFSSYMSLSDQREARKVLNEIKVCYINAVLSPQLEDADVHFKEVYLQKKETAQNAALQHIEQNFGQLYHDNNFSALKANFSMPNDIVAGTCPTADNSDVVEDVLNISSLLLMPTGLDFIPDALSVAYYAAQDRTMDMLLSSAALVIPGSPAAFKKAITTGADVINEVSRGAKIEKTTTALVAYQPHINLLESAFRVEASQMTSGLIAKIHANPQILVDMLKFDASNAKLMSNVSEQLTEAKKIEFLNKAIDEPSFLQKVKSDPDEVLKWAGVLRTIENFIPSSGTKLLGKENKTTTLLGRWLPDMSEVKKHLVQKEFNVGTEFGTVTECKGGFNFLNIPDELANASSDFFEQYNKPWLQKAIERGDEIILTTRPININDYISATGELKGMYTKELRYLVLQNYKPSNLTVSEWETIKTWFQ